MESDRNAQHFGGYLESEVNLRWRSTGSSILSVFPQLQDLEEAEVIPKH